MKMIVLLIIFMLASYSYANQEPYQFTIAETKRFESLTKEIRCLVCQNQSLADSNAPLANDLRDKIHKMILEKKSNAAIKQYLVKRYGEYILLNPSLNKMTVLLWSFPFLGIMLVFVLLFRLVRV